MILYSIKDAEKYKSFTITEKKYCKRVIINLLEVNKITRDPDTIGVWFRDPEKLKKSSIIKTITFPTMLFSMKAAISIIIERGKSENNELFNFLK